MCILLSKGSITCNYILTLPFHPLSWKSPKTLCNRKSFNSVFSWALIVFKGLGYMLKEIQRPIWCTPYSPERNDNFLRQDVNCSMFKAQIVLRSKEGNITSRVYVCVEGGRTGIEKLHQQGSSEMEVGTSGNIHLQQRSLGYVWRTGRLCFAWGSQREGVEGEFVKWADHIAHQAKEEALNRVDNMKIHFSTKFLNADLLSIRHQPH